MEIEVSTTRNKYRRKTTSLHYFQNVKNRHLLYLRSFSSPAVHASGKLSPANCSRAVLRHVIFKIVRVIASCFRAVFCGGTHHSVPIAYRAAHRPTSYVTARQATPRHAMPRYATTHRRPCTGPLIVISVSSWYSCSTIHVA